MLMLQLKWKHTRLPWDFEATSQAYGTPTVWSDCNHKWQSAVSTGCVWCYPVADVLLTGHEQVQGYMSGYCVQQKMTWT